VAAVVSPRMERIIVLVKLEYNEAEEYVKHVEQQEETMEL
jgi:hypothetical protein